MENNLSTITTVIPTYRRPKQLKRAIQSVLNQNYHQLEVHVYDNASGDETCSVVQEFMKKDYRVKYYCHPKNIGATANFNFGMKQVKTPFFSFLSDDDLIFPNFYKDALEGFTKYPDAYFSAMHTLYINKFGQIFKRFPPKFQDGLICPPDGFLNYIKFHHSKCLAWTGILFNAKYLEKIGFLREHHVVPDLEYLLRIMAKGPFVYSSKVGAAFRISDEHISFNNRLNPEADNSGEIIKTLFDDSDELSPYLTIFAKNITRSQMEIFFPATVCDILKGNTKAASVGLSIFKNLPYKRFFSYYIYLTCMYSLLCGKFFAIFYNMLFNMYRIIKQIKSKSYFSDYDVNKYEGYIKQLENIES